MPTKMFMWQWQQVFVDAVRQLFVSICKTLELPIASNIFVIGIPIDSLDVTRIFFYREDCGFKYIDFKQVFAIAQSNFERDPEQLFFMGNAHLDRVHKESLYPKGLQKAVGSILEKRDLKRGRISFCSFPIQKNEHWITTVIQIPRQDFENQYRLSQATHEVSPMRRHRIDRCFLEALIYRVLRETA